MHTGAGVVPPVFRTRLRFFWAVWAEQRSLECLQILVGLAPAWGDVMEAELGSTKRHMNFFKPCMLRLHSLPSPVI